MKTIHTFYDWYIGTLNSKIYSDLVRPVKSDNGMTKLDVRRYAEELTALGTFTDHFIATEFGRVETCNLFLRSITWEKFNELSIQDYNKKCDFLYFYYWLFNNVDTKGVEVRSITKNGKKSVVKLVLIVAELESQQDTIDHEIHVTLKKGDKIWLINELERR
jgi:hypothetical protein